MEPPFFDSPLVRSLSIIALSVAPPLRSLTPVKNLVDIDGSLEAAADIDMVFARARLGRRLGGTVPVVGEEGCIELRGFRHPVLVLKQQGIHAVPSPTSSSSSSSGSMLSPMQQQEEERVGVEGKGASRPWERWRQGTGADDKSARALPCAPGVVGNDLSLNSSMPGLVSTRRALGNFANRI
jgi:hypothetical protein